MRLVFALMLASPANAIGIHSDLPLFTFSHDELQPVHFYDEDGSFGCSSRVAFGDWKWTEVGKDASDEESWLRLTNYGVFHCAIIERWADDRGGLDRASHKYSWFVKIGEVGRGAARRELWALQSGSRPGSDYLLLSRAKGPGLIKQFDVLTVDCPSRFLREAGSFDVWGTSYCSINSAEDLKTLAKRMAEKEPIALLKLEGPSPEAPESEE